MKRLAALGMLVLAVPTWAFAHVSVRPRESRPNSEERYTLRVSTEGTGDGAQSQSSSTADPAAIEAWLKSYDAAFNAKDLDKLATFYHSEVTIFEGGGVNRGWADYRDHHLGPELKQFGNLQSNTAICRAMAGHGWGVRHIGLRAEGENGRARR